MTGAFSSAKIAYMTPQPQVDQLLTDIQRQESLNSLKERLSEALQNVQLSNYEGAEFRQMRLGQLLLWMVKNDRHGLYRKGITELHDHKGNLMVSMIQRPLPEQAMFLITAWELSNEEYVRICWPEGETMISTDWLEADNVATIISEANAEMFEQYW